jgi:hypothetical protein
MRKNTESIQEGFVLMNGKQLIELRHHKKTFSQRPGKKTWV